MPGRRSKKIVTYFVCSVCVCVGGGGGLVLTNGCETQIVFETAAALN